mmetsp:Transcript_23586/g.76100  ORF Transcript_23586/g.76100 Transcript_23586/m.76100 type:complete len:224 (+) Transcript_23586:635-1306(+)
MAAARRKGRVRVVRPLLHRHVRLLGGVAERLGAPPVGAVPQVPRVHALLRRGGRRADPAEQQVEPDVRIVVGVHPKGEVVRGDGPAPRGDHLRKDGLVALRHADAQQVAKLGLLGVERRALFRCRRLAEEEAILDRALQLLLTQGRQVGPANRAAAALVASGGGGADEKQDIALLSGGGRRSRDRRLRRSCCESELHDSLGGWQGGHLWRFEGEVEEEGRWRE